MQSGISAITCTMRYVQYRNIAVPVFALFLLLSCSSQNNLPALPNLDGYPSIIQKHIFAAHQKVSDNSFDDNAVGEMAMTLHSNLFYAEAQDWYLAAQKLDSTEWLWHYYPSLIKEEIGDANAAIAGFKKVVTLNPKVSNAWYKLGASYLKQNNYDDANTSFARVKETKSFRFAADLPDKGAFPLYVYAGLSLGRVYVAQGKYDVAERELQQLIREHPRFGSSYRLLGEVYQLRGEQQKSRDAVLRAGDFENYIPPSDPMFNSLLLKTRDSNSVLKQIDIAIQSENFAWADMLCDFILEYDPQNMDAIAKSILLNLVKNEKEGLAAKSRKFFEFNQLNDEKLFELSETFYRWNQPLLAAKYLEGVMTVNPKAIDAHILYLKILVKTKEDKKAIAHCKIVLDDFPENSELRTEYGRILLLQGNEAEAKLQLKKAIENDPDNEVPHIILGIMAQNKKEINSALQSYQKAVRINPLNVNAVTRLGNYLLSLQRWEEAASVYKSALTSSPNSIDLLERNAWVLSTSPNQRLRDGEKALRLAKRLTFIRKEQPRQDVECGITLAAAYAEQGDFESAKRILNGLIPRAQSTRLTSYVPRIQSLIQQFELKKPLRMQSIYSSE